MTRVSSIVERIIHLIDSDILKPGHRVLSVRAGGIEYGVSKNTMAEAYDRLVALGYLSAKQGSGYYVAQTKRPLATERPPHVIEAVDFVSLLEEQLVQHYAVRVGDGRPPASWTERIELGSSARHLSPTGESDHGYGTPHGFAPLRERVALALAERSIQVSLEQIILTHGANHALDLIARRLLQPGDTVLVDDPGYYPLFAKLKLLGVNIVGVRRLGDGPDRDDLAAKAAIVKPKVFFTQSLAHNPTGSSLSLPVAHRLLQVAESHGFYVVEDDPFADILPSSSARLAALDQLGRVIYVGTFSKTLSASLRVGYIAAEPSLAKTLCDLKMVTITSTSEFVERVVYSAITGGQYLRHLRRLKARVATATEAAVARLKEIGIEFPIAPSGGYYLWGQLPPGVDERDLAKRAAEQSIFVAPGSLFTPEKTMLCPMMRINVAYANDARFLEFMREYLASQRQSAR
ncbi:aminotransferase-like domain-containing protein [Microvirga roseola]|uniref:aminotransferase-like domain-containing protein n=1 Tax=Microvirga roseola TaxID=2883126 RepID=UPI001E40383E|nr:PLP-dependent aminotransferase family protein [Microvirga roseola]